jgi:hypothetical protein
MPCGPVLILFYSRREIHSEESPKSKLKRPRESHDPDLRIPPRPGPRPVYPRRMRASSVEATEGRSNFPAWTNFLSDTY